MPRFTIKSLLLATTLIAVGMGLIYLASQPHNVKGDDILPLVAFLGGSGLIGVGLMAPFKRAWTEAIAVILLELLIALALPPVH